MGKTSRPKDKKIASPSTDKADETSTGGDQSAFITFCKVNKQLMQWVCFIGIILCYSYYALLQETLVGNKELKLNVSLILCFQYAIAVAISASIILISGQGKLTDSLTYDDFVVSFFGFMSMNFSNKALRYVSAPFVMLSKSAKVIPVILVGTLRGVYTPTLKQFGVAFFITVGLVTFNLNKMKPKNGDDAKNDNLGIFLVVASLLFDGLTATQTDKQHKKSKRDSAYPSMFTNNLFGLVISIGIYAFEVITYGDDSHNIIFSTPKLLYESVAIGLCGSIGQVFIFLCVTLFDCYLLTIITTTRKFFSVVYSNFKFGHNFNDMQWIGALMVMACTFIELFSKKDKKDKKDEKSPEVVPKGKKTN